MKKIFYSLIAGLAFAVLLGGCTKFNDQFKGLDEMTKPTNVAALSYTLTAADYAAMKTAALKVATTPEQIAAANSIVSFSALNSTYGSADYVPALLNKMYFSFDKGSSALITYNYNIGSPAYFNDLTTVNILQNADYQLAWGGAEYVSAFTPTVSPSAKLPVVLAAKFPAATAGQYAFAEYNYSNEDATSQSTEVKYLFEDWTNHSVTTVKPYAAIGGENGWISKDVKGTQNWYCRTYNTNNYAQASSNATLEINENWMISPEIDLQTATAPQFTFDLVIGYWNSNCLSVWISENFDGTEGGIATATWTNISSNFTFPETPVTGYTPAFINAGVANLTAYAGKKVRIAFKYDGDGRSATDRGTDPLRTTTYELDNIKVSEQKIALSVTSTEKQYAAYQFNGSNWVPADNTFVALQPADYTTMGLSYVSTTNAPLYIPQLLSQKFPFAQEGNVKTVVYKSGSNVTYAGAMQFTFTSGKWMQNTFKIQKTEQFVYSNSGWVFDPTVNLTMAKSDYQLMIDYVLATPEIAQFGNSQYKNEEFWWGFSSRYSNLSLRLSYRNPFFSGYPYELPASADAELFAKTTDADKIALLWTRVQSGMEKFAQLRFPNAVPNVSGIDVFYHLTTYVYYPTGVAAGYEYHEYVFQCTAAASGGNPPTFKYISDQVKN